MQGTLMERLAFDHYSGQHKENVHLGCTKCRAGKQLALFDLLTEETSNKLWDLIDQLEVVQENEGDSTRSRQLKAVIDGLVAIMGSIEG